MTSLDVLCRLGAIYIIRMKFHKNKLLTTGAAVALALAVGACSSSSDDDEMAVTTPPVVMPPVVTPPVVTPPVVTPPVVTPEPHACDAGPSQACVDARQTELEAIENDSAATVGALNAAQMALAAAHTALSDANTAHAEEMTVSGLIDDAITATADIDDESTPAAVDAGRVAIDAAKESLGGMENLSDDATAALQGRIDVLESSFSPIEMAVKASAVTAAAATKRMEIAAEADDADAGLGGSTASAIEDGVEGSYALSIERDRMATSVTVTVNGATDDDDVEFMQAMDFGDGRTMHTRTMEADADGNVVEEVVIVSTDIDAPKATPFAMVEGQALLVNPKTTGGSDYRSITVVAGDADVNLPKIMSAEFTAGTKAVLTFDSNDSATDDEDEAFETVGTYNGAMGTYRCDGDR